MTKNEALREWSEACIVIQAGPVMVRDGNWMPIDRALRHCADTTTVDARKDEFNGDVVVDVVPVPKDAAKGKTPMTLAPFMLVVK